MHKICYELTLWLVELLSQLKMQNMTMKCSNIINYNNSDNIYTLTTAWHYHETHFALIIGLITISNTLLQLLTFKCTMVIYHFFMYYCNWLLLYAPLQLTTIVWFMSNDNYCMLQNNIKNISYIDCHNTYKLITAL